MLAHEPLRHAAVIFDCDGTLVDSMPLHFEAWNDAFRRNGASFDFTWELFNARAGMTLERTVVELNEQFGCQLNPERVAADQRAAFLRRQDQISPIPFVAEFARSLRGRVPLAIASGSNRASVDHALAKTDMLEWFEVVITSSDGLPGKPAPDMFLEAASRMGVQAHECLVIEDGRPGIEAAHRADMDAFFITRDGGVEFRPSPRGSAQRSARG